MNRDWTASFDALKKIYLDDAYANQAINEALKEHPGSSPGFVRVMSKGVVRNTMLLDHTIASFAARGLKGIKKRTLIVLRMGFYALACMDGVPDHAAVNETVSLAKKVSRGSSGFVNALLRAFLRSGFALPIPDGTDSRSLSLRYSVPEPVVELLLAQYGEDEGAHILAALQEVPNLCLRSNGLKIERAALIERLCLDGHEARKDEESEHGIFVEGGALVGSRLYEEGFFTVQNSSSIRAVEALSPKPGQRLLDLCAAPGGKTAFMAELMQNRGEIVACDLHPHRVTLMENTFRRMGAEIVRAEQRDATVFAEEYEEAFDGVLADVPCSGLGVMASKPELRLRLDPGTFPELLEIQASILENAYRYTKPGGLLMYATCTLNRNENERQITRFRDKYPSAETVDINLILPYNKNAGFFYCLMRKADSGNNFNELRW